MYFSKIKYIPRIAVCLVCCLALLINAPALDVEIPENLRDDRNLPREERIRRHQKRVNLILEARKKAKELERKQKLEEARKKAEEAARQRKTPDKPPPPPEGPLSFTQTSSNILAHTILHFYPFDLTVVVGKNFLTDVELFNIDRISLNELKVKIVFDPRFIQPIMINDNEINHLVEGEPVYKINMKSGEIIYQCTFQQPQMLLDTNILRIVWKALKPTDYCEISFDLTEGNTALLVEGEDILGIPKTPHDGMIPTGIIIQPEFKKSKTQNFQFSPILKHSLKKGLAGEEFEGNITLKMESEKKFIPVGETFQVSVYLSNPEAEIFDNFSLLIKYDPGVLQVLDSDKRNWIRQGININDGFARKKYPFNYHLRNEVNNITGAIDYRMGASQMDPFPSGEMARIKFLAAAPAENTKILFARDTGARFPNTSVTSMGEELLSPTQWVDKTLRSLTLHVVDRSQ